MVQYNDTWLERGTHMLHYVNSVHRDANDTSEWPAVAEDLKLAWARAASPAPVASPQLHLRSPLSVVDDNQKVVGALSVVGATKMIISSLKLKNTFN